MNETLADHEILMTGEIWLKLVSKRYEWLFIIDVTFFGGYLYSRGYQTKKGFEQYPWL